LRGSVRTFSATRLTSPLLALVRVAAKWGAVRFGRDALRLQDVPPNVGLATVAQGATALALGFDVFIMYGRHGAGGAGGAALLTTVVVGVAAAQLAAPSLVTLAIQVAPLTRAPGTPDLNHNAPAE